MTNWLPNLTSAPGPLYVRLADRIEQDIARGLLPAGGKLPPQRNLAYDLGVTVGTIGRAYALVRERGLVSGEVGRGTYVLPGRGGASRAPVSGAANPLDGTRAALPRAGHIRMDSTAAPDVGQAKVIERLTHGITTHNGHEIASYTRTLPDDWLHAGKRWLACADWSPAVETLVPTLGGHAAVLAIVAAMTVPGDFIAFESLTYSSLARSANLIGRRSCVVDRDDEGAIPEDFERLCAQQHPKALFVMPAVQNPTLAVMSPDRRAAIVEIARRFNVWLIEDAVYGSLHAEQSAPLAALAPERTFHVGSLSKSVAAGVRGGWVACPPAYAQRILTSHKMVTGGIPFLLAELAARLVLSGEADVIRDAVRAEIAARGTMAQASFKDLEFTANPQTPFLWLKLSDPWLSATFKNAAANESVLIDDEDEFKPGRTEQVHHRVRIGFTTPQTRAEVQTGFDVIRQLLDNAGASYDSYG